MGEKERLLKEAAKAAQTSDMNLTPTNSVGSSSEMDSPLLLDQRSARIYPLGIAKKCAFTLEEDRMMKLNEEMEKHLDMSQVLHAKSAKGKLSPILQGQIYKNRRDTFYKTENMLADTGCSYNICGEQICRDLRIRIFLFKNNMQIMDASGNFLKLIGSAVLYIGTQVLGLNTIKKLEVAVQKQGVSDEREILLTLKTLMDWNIVHPGFPHIKLDDYVENLVNKQIHQNKACTTVYSQTQKTRVNDTDGHIRVRKFGENLNLSEQDLACSKLQGYLLKKCGSVFAEKLSPKDRINCSPVRIVSL